MGRLSRSSSPTSSTSGRGCRTIIAKRTAGATGIPRDRLQLVGTHTHSGPALDEASDVEERIGEQIGAAVAQAWADRRPALAAVGVGTVHGIGANRRPDGGPVDDRVMVARFDDTDGRPIATLVNYGCHPTTLGPNNLLYSADYPGVACRDLDEAIGGVALFTTGPQGDVNPGGYSPEGSMIGIVVPWRTFESAERYGRLFADCATEVHAQLHPTAADSVWGVAEILASRGSRCRMRRASRAAVEAARRPNAPFDVRGPVRRHAIYHAAAAAPTQTWSLPGGRPRPRWAGEARISALGLGSSSMSVSRASCSWRSASTSAPGSGTSGHASPRCATARSATSRPAALRGRRLRAGASVLARGRGRAPRRRDRLAGDRAIPIPTG